MEDGAIYLNLPPVELEGTWRFEFEVMHIRPLMALSIALAAAGFGPACNTSPTGPTMWPPPASRGEPVLRNVELMGPQVVRPGESVQFSLLARMSDGSSRDVTSEARWSSVAKKCRSISSAL